MTSKSYDSFEADTIRKIIFNEIIFDIFSGFNPR